MTEPAVTEPKAEDVAQGILADRAMAAGEAVSSIDEDPERAARAMTLGDVTGVPAPIVHSDLDQFERDTRTTATGALIKSNPHLSGYINDNAPMAARVSTDDWSNLDQWSESLEKLAERTRRRHRLPREDESLNEQIDVPGWAGRTMLEAAKGVVTGVTEPIQRPLARAEAERKAGVPFWESVLSGIVHTPKDSWDLGVGLVGAFPPFAIGSVLLAPPMDLATSIYAEGVVGVGRGIEALFPKLRTTTEQKEKMRQEAKEEAGRYALWGIRASKSRVDTAIKADLEGIVRNGETFLKQGEVSPPGLFPAIDKIHEETAKGDLTALDIALKEADKTNTRPRSAKLAEAFVRQHGVTEDIGITPEAVRELYGDKVPAEGDGVLGWVPDLGEKLRLAEQTGGDIHIPLSEWLAKVDPAVAKDLRDNIRVRPDGVTLSEMAGLKEWRKLLAASKPRPEAEAEPGPEAPGEVKPPEAVEGAKPPEAEAGAEPGAAEPKAAPSAPETEPLTNDHATYRRASGVLPMRGPKLGLERLVRKGRPAVGEEGLHNFAMVDESGGQVGHLMLS